MGSTYPWFCFEIVLKLGCLTCCREQEQTNAPLSLNLDLPPIHLTIDSWSRVTSSQSSTH